MLFVVFAFAAVLAQASPSGPTTPPMSSSSTAPSSSAPSSSAQATSADASQKKVCKDVANEGSRTTHQECHTQAEWDQMSQDANNMAAPPH